MEKLSPVLNSVLEALREIVWGESITPYKVRGRESELPVFCQKKISVEGLLTFIYHSKMLNGRRHKIKY